MIVYGTCDCDSVGERIHRADSWWHVRCNECRRLIWRTTKLATSLMRDHAERRIQRRIDTIMTTLTGGEEQ